MVMVMAMAMAMAMAMPSCDGHVPVCHHMCVHFLMVAANTSRQHQHHHPLVTESPIPADFFVLDNPWFPARQQLSTWPCPATTTRSNPRSVSHAILHSRRGRLHRNDRRTVLLTPSSETDITICEPDVACPRLDSDDTQPLQPR
jgi:hypothetical protein